MHADPLSLVGGKTLDQQTVQIDETLQKSPRRIELDREPPFREIDLDDMRAFLQAAPDLAFLLVEKIIEVILPRIAVDAALRIQQTQGGRRNDGLLDRHMRVALGSLQIHVGRGAVAERPAGQARKVPDVAVRERNRNAVRRDILQPRDRIGGKALLALLAVGNHRRSRRFQALDGAANGGVAHRIQLLLRRAPVVEGLDRIDQRGRSRNASDRFRRQSRASVSSGRQSGTAWQQSSLSPED